MIGLSEIEAAREVLCHAGLPTTPMFRSQELTARIGAPVWIKAESLQRTGSFKIRGAMNRIANMSDEDKTRGVVAASAGNHAQGVAAAAAHFGVPATVFMPRDAPLVKLLNTRGHGARVELVEGNIEEALAEALILRDRDGLTFIHPFDDPLIQAGQGTAGLEVHNDLPQAATVLVPVGGGGLLSGMAVALKALNPEVRLYGVQAEGAAAAVASLQAGKLVELERADTMADGIRLRRVAASTLEVMQTHVEDVLTVSDEAISQAMVVMLEQERLVVEAAGAAGVAALLSGKFPDAARSGPIVVVLSGGNTDTNLLARVIERGRMAAGRSVVLRVRIPDQPGYLKEILEAVAGRRANILDIAHDRTVWRVPVGDVEVEMLLEIRDPEHGRNILDDLRQRGMAAELWDQRREHDRLGDSP